MHSRCSLIAAAFLLIAHKVLAQGVGPGPTGAVSPPRAFVENRGQWANGSHFQMRRGNSLVAVRPDGFTIQMLRIDRNARDHGADGRDEPATVSGWNLALTFRGASPDAVVRGTDELPGVYNYLRGSDRSEWVTKVRGFGRVRIAGLYPGIDLDLYERDGSLEYDLVLEPGADPSSIVIDVVGVDSIAAENSGRLQLRTPWQGVIHSSQSA